MSSSIGSLRSSWDEWTSANRPGFVAIRIVGEPDTPRSHEMKDRWSRSGVPFEFYPPDSDGGRALLARWDKVQDELPIVILFDRQALAAPTNEEVVAAFAESIPFDVSVEPEERSFDLVVVGAGTRGACRRGQRGFRGPPYAGCG